jgi:Dolichyl-phosphate-mannose-protein mannosyltransferase
LSPPSGSRPAPLALAALLLLASLLAAGSWRVYSNTWDEPEHLGAGIELLDRGQYQYDTEHPPLGRILLALPPYLAGAHSYGTAPPDGTREGVDILYAGGHYWRTLTLARLGTLGFLPLLLFVTWLWARRLFATPAAALLAVALLISVPAVLGHAALASLDVAAAATILLALYLLVRWVISARLTDAVWFGLASGVAVTTKFSAVPFIGLALLVLLGMQVLALRRAPSSGPAPPIEWRTRLLGLLLAGASVLVPIFLVYGPRAPDAAGVALRYNWALSYLLQRPDADHALGVALTHLPLPRELKDLLNGLVAVEAHNNTGHRSYLLGEVRIDGWWYFYLVALAVKTPLPLLALGIWGLAWMGTAGWRRGDTWLSAPGLVALTLLGFASVFSRINIGIRHVLILYPFLALGAAYAGLQLWQATARSRTAAARSAARATLLALLAWQMSVLVSAYPDYLPYFNAAVRHPERVLVDSDLDWGQDLYRLELRAAQLKIRRLHLAYRGTADLAQEPLPPFDILPPHRPVSGWVAVSQLARTRAADDYAWLDAWRPLERIGKTIDLYYIP